MESVSDERGLRRRAWLISVPLGLLVLMLGPLSVFLSAGGPWYGWLPGVAWMVFGVCQFWGVQRRYRDSVRVLRADYRVCLHCRQDLSGLDDDGICPECAKGYTREFLIEDWKKRCVGFLSSPWGDGKKTGPPPNR